MLLDKETKQNSSSVRLSLAASDKTSVAEPSSLPLSKTPHFFSPMDEKKCEQIVSDMQKSLGKLTDEATDIKSFIKEQISSVAAAQVSYFHCLKKVANFLSSKLEKMDENVKADLPLENAWFFWKYSCLRRIEFHYQPPSLEAEHLLHRLQIANEAANQLLFRGGSTDIEDNEKDKNENQKKLDEIRGMREVVDEKYAKIIWSLENPTKEERDSLRLAIVVETAAQKHMGCCYEKSLVLINCLRKQRALELGKLNAEVEVISVDGNNDGGVDHLLTLAGRAPGSDINDYTTWGSKAVLSDPLRGVTFFPKDTQGELTGFRTQETNGENSLPAFHPYNYSLSSYYKNCVAALKKGYKILHINDPQAASLPPVESKPVEKIIVFNTGDTSSAQALILRCTRQGFLDTGVSFAPGIPACSSASVNRYPEKTNNIPNGHVSPGSFALIPE